MRQYFTDDIGAEHASMQSYEALYSLILKGFYPITSLLSGEGTCPRIAVAQ